MTRIRGTITHWNRRKAYGFITPDDESKEVFVHISEFRDRREMPALEEWVEFSPSTDKQGRPCAADVSRMDSVEESGSSGASKWPWVVGAAVVIVVAGFAVMSMMR